MVRRENTALPVRLLAQLVRWILHRLGWLWRRLGDIQTVEWIYQQWFSPGWIGLVVSAAVTWLGARLGDLSGPELFGLAIMVFAVAMPGFRLWRSRRRKSEPTPLFLRPSGEINRANRDDLPPAPPGVQPEHIRRDLGRLITEGEEFIQRRLSLSARSMLDRMVPQGIWDFYVTEWRDRTLAYFNDARLDSAAFVECSPPEVKTLTLDQLRCHVDRLRESL